MKNVEFRLLRLHEFFPYEYKRCMFDMYFFENSQTYDNELYYAK